MIYQAYNYTHSESEFAEMRALLRKTAAHSKLPLTWRLAQHENWYYASLYTEPREYFTSRVQLWRDTSGKLGAFCIRCCDTGHLILDPALEKDMEMRAAMLEWVETHWGNANRAVELLAYEQDIEQHHLLAQRGYLDEGYVSWLRVYDITREIPAAALPSGFRFATLAETGAREERIELERAVWKRPDLDETWFKGKSSSPVYSFDWDILAVSSQRELAAFVVVWVDWQNHSAEIDPMGTHPDYRHQGIARALVIEAFQRLNTAGISRLTIESESDPDHPANRLYASLDPIGTHRSHRWVKRF